MGKLHKDSSQNLCNLSIDKNAGRLDRAREAQNEKSQMFTHLG